MEDTKMNLENLTLLDSKQTANLLNLKLSRLRELVHENEIPAFRIGRLLRFSKEELSKWLETKTEKVKENEAE